MGGRHADLEQMPYIHVSVVSHSCGWRFPPCWCCANRSRYCFSSSCYFCDHGLFVCGVISHVQVVSLLHMLHRRVWKLSCSISKHVAEVRETLQETCCASGHATTIWWECSTTAPARRTSSFIRKTKNHGIKREGLESEIC